MLPDQINKVCRYACKYQLWRFSGAFELSAQARQAAQAAEILFGNTAPEDIQKLSERELLSTFANAPQMTISKAQWNNLTDVTDLVSSATQGMIFKSKGEARRIIQGRGLSINKVKVTDPHQMPNCDLLNGRYLLVQQGKKQYYLITIQ